MSKQEVLALLLPYYKEHLEVVKGMSSAEKAYKYLQRNNLQFGICNCAYEQFEVILGCRGWVWELTKEDENGDKEYWAPTPWHANSLSDIIDALQIRIDIMESLLQTPETTNA